MLIGFLKVESAIENRPQPNIRHFFARRDDGVRTIGDEVAVAPIHLCVSMFLRIVQINDPTRITWLTEMHLALRLFR